MISLIKDLMAFDIKVILQLLSYLEKRQNSWVPYEILEQESEISRPTLVKYLKNIKEENETSFTLEMSRSNGVRIVIFDSFLFGLYYRKKVFEIQPIQLIYQLLLNGKIDKKEFCETFFISKSFLEKQIPKINAVVEQFSLTMNSKNGYFYLVGEESQIRRLLEEIIWEVFRGYEWPFGFVDEMKVKKVITCLLADEKIKVSSRRLLEYRLGILLVRYNNKNYFKMDCLLFEDLLKKNKEFNRIANVFKTVILLSDEEIQYFLLTILANRNYFAVENINQLEIFKFNEQFKVYFSTYIRVFTKEDIQLLDSFLLSIHVYCLLYSNTKHIFQNQRKTQIRLNAKIQVELEEYLQQLFIKNSEIKLQNLEFLRYKYEQIISNLFSLKEITPLNIVGVNTDMNTLEEMKFIDFLDKTLNCYANVVVINSQNIASKEIDCLIYTNRELDVSVSNSIFINRYRYLQMMPDWLPKILRLIM